MYYLVILPVRAQHCKFIDPPTWARRVATPNVKGDRRPGLSHRAAVARDSHVLSGRSTEITDLRSRGFWIKASGREHPEKPSDSRRSQESALRKSLLAASADKHQLTTVQSWAEVHWNPRRSIQCAESLRRRWQDAAVIRRPITIAFQWRGVVNGRSQSRRAAKALFAP